LSWQFESICRSLAPSTHIWNGGNGNGKGNSTQTQDSTSLRSRLLANTIPYRPSSPPSPTPSPPPFCEPAQEQHQQHQQQQQRRHGSNISHLPHLAFCQDQTPGLVRWAEDSGWVWQLVGNNKDILQQQRLWQQQQQQQLKMRRARLSCRLLLVVPVRSLHSVVPWSVVPGP